MGLKQFNVPNREDKVICITIEQPITTKDVVQLQKMLDMIVSVSSNENYVVTFPHNKTTGEHEFKKTMVESYSPMDMVDKALKKEQDAKDCKCNDATYIRNSL